MRYAWMKVRDARRWKRKGTVSVLCRANNKAILILTAGRNAGVECRALGVLSPSYVPGRKGR